MKWNWGTGIFIVIVLFLIASVAFIVYTRHETWSLVEEDYYPKELRHEEKLVKIRNAQALATPMVIALDESNLRLAFPPDFRGMAIKGTIQIYRPSDESLDVNLPVQVDTALTQVFPRNRLSHGRYVVKVDWTAGGKGFFVEKDIFIP